MTDKQPRNRAGRFPRGKRRAFGKGSKERFVKLDFWLLESEAWRALSLGARCQYLEVRQRFNGSNNGHISFSVREVAKKLGISKDTAAKWFIELEEKGFLKLRQDSSFDYKKRLAREWIITAESYNDKQATRDFLQWKPEKQTSVLTSRTHCPSQRDKGARNNPSNGLVCPSERDKKRPIPTSDRPTERDTYNLPGGRCFTGHPVQANQGNVVALPPIPPFLDRRRKAMGP